MPNIGPLELLVVLIIGLLVLGPKRLPDAGRSIGRGLREFKQAISGDGHDATVGDLHGPHDLVRVAGFTGAAAAVTEHPGAAPSFMA